MAPADQGPGEGSEPGTGEVTWPTGILVGQKDDPHRSVPDVVLFKSGELSSQLSGFLPQPSDHLAQETEPE
jgi:hypothetical protein